MEKSRLYLQRISFLVQLDGLSVCETLDSIICGTSFYKSGKKYIYCYFLKHFPFFTILKNSKIGHPHGNAQHNAPIPKFLCKKSRALSPGFLTRLELGMIVATSQTKGLTLKCKLMCWLNMASVWYSRPQILQTNSGSSSGCGFDRWTAI